VGSELSANLSQNPTFVHVNTYRNEKLVEATCYGYAPRIGWKCPGCFVVLTTVKSAKRHIKKPCTREQDLTMHTTALLWSSWVNSFTTCKMESLSTLVALVNCPQVHSIPVIGVPYCCWLYGEDNCDRIGMATGCDIHIDGVVVGVDFDCVDGVIFLFLLTDSFVDVGNFRFFEVPFCDSPPVFAFGLAVLQQCSNATPKID